MDSRGSYDTLDVPPEHTFEPVPPPMARGVRLLLSTGAIIALLVIIALVAVLVVVVKSQNTEATSQSLLQRLSVLSGLVAESARRHYFSSVFDARTLAPVNDPRAYLFGLSSGNSLAIVRGWLDMLLTAASDASHVGYNLTLTYPGGKPVSAMVLETTSFNVFSQHLVAKASATLCGGPDADVPRCTPSGLVTQNVFAGEGTLPQTFVQQAGAVDNDPHIVFFLVIYTSFNTTAPLANEDATFVIEIVK